MNVIVRIIANLVAVSSQIAAKEMWAKELIWGTYEPGSNMCLNNTEWCEEPMYYPHRAIRAALLNNNSPWMNAMVTNGLELRNVFDNEEEYEEDSTFENICGSSSVYTRPRAAMNKEGKERFIVNQPDGAEEYVQLVKVVMCELAGEECGWGVVAGRETRCQQEYLDHKLVALSDRGQELVIDTFTFPSCCTCLIKITDF